MKKTNQKQNQNTTITSVAICVRVTQSEYKQLFHDSIITGKNKPTLLREKYFKGEIISPLLSKEEAHSIYKELIRVGSNVAQITRTLDGGFREGFNKHLEEINENLTMLKTFILGAYGNH